MDKERYPRLSVIVPVYNQENNIRKCLDSIVNQTYSDFECVCIDNGSTDRSLEIMLEYEKDPRFKVYHKEHGGGVSAARNYGLDRIHGEIVSFIDSDDYVDVRLFELTVPHMDECDFVQFNVYNEDSSGLRHWDLPAEGLVDLTFGISDRLRTSAWSKIYNVELLKKTNLRFPEGLNNEDCMFTHAYRTLVDKTYLVNEPLYYYVTHESSLTAIIHKKPNDKNLDQIRTIVPFHRFLVSNDILERGAQRHVAMCFSYTWFVMKTVPYKLKVKAFFTALSVARRTHLMESVRLCLRNGGLRMLVEAIRPEPEKVVKRL